ncbi:hypothetical protein D8B29_00605 [Verminephrobacter eiseniae]|nr:hypothetical protein [Verminephrobacter eiseniae]MCW8178199.1 hypothetical protein [Verminephrobacter eiseniae]MCW8188428.1 hypothetical protein [Verminephrobacter eiseniae]
MMKIKRLVLPMGLTGLVVATSVACAETLKRLAWSGLAPPESVKKSRQKTGIDVQVTFSNHEDTISRLRAAAGAVRPLLRCARAPSHASRGSQPHVV